MAQRVPARLSPAQGRKFAFTVGLAFLVLGGIVAWRGHFPVAVGFWSVSGLLLAAGVVVPGRLSPVYRAWMGLALAISKVTTPIFLSIVFYLVIAPVGLVMRLLGRNPMRHRAVNGSFWADHAPPNERGAMTNQF